MSSSKCHLLILLHTPHKLPLSSSNFFKPVIHVSETLDLRSRALPSLLHRQSLPTTTSLLFSSFKPSSTGALKHNNFRQTCTLTMLLHHLGRSDLGYLHRRHHHVQMMKQKEQGREGIKHWRRSWMDKEPGGCEGEPKASRNEQKVWDDSWTIISS